VTSHSTSHTPTTTRNSTDRSRRGFLRVATGAGVAAGAVALLGIAPNTRAARASQSMPSPSPATDDPDFALLSKQVQAAMQRYGVPGVAVGVLAQGREHLAGFGVTNVESPRPVDIDTLFQVGSLAKLATSTAIMRLVEQGCLSLDAPVRDYLPDLTLADAAVADRVTLAHLLTHTSGWTGDFFPDTGRGNDALARYVAAMAKLPQVSAPGRYLSYDNAGYALAGRVLEYLAGKPYETTVKELLFTPLAMPRSTFFAEEAITQTVAAGH
jgi:CubicO group peptidase (beta-lactamase class C family)